MAISIDFNLPKDHPARFPDRCVECGRERPDGVYRASTHAIGWWTWLFWSRGRRFEVDVPACTGCSARLRRQRWGRFAVGLVVTIVGVSLAMYLLGTFTSPLRKWLAMGIALLCLLPVVLWESLVPLAIDLTAYSETIDYEFRDAAYAYEFAALNGVAGFAGTTDPGDEPAAAAE